MERFLARLRGGSKVNANDFGLSVEDVVSYFSGSGDILDLRVEIDAEGNASGQDPRTLRMAKVTTTLMKESLDSYLQSQPEGSRGHIVMYGDILNEIRVPSELPDLVWLDADPADRHLSPTQVFEEASFILKVLDRENNHARKKAPEALYQRLSYGKAKLGILIDPFSRLVTVFRRIGEQVVDLTQETWGDLDVGSVFPGLTLSFTSIDAIEVPGPGLTILRKERTRGPVVSNATELETSTSEGVNSEEINVIVEADLESVEVTVKSENRAEVKGRDADQPGARKRSRRIGSCLETHTPSTSRISESLASEMSSHRYSENPENPEDIPIYVMFVFPDNDDMDYMWPGMYVPPSDREGTIDSTSRSRFSIGSHVESCAPDIPLIRYFEDGSYAALDSAEVHFEFYDPSDFQFETFIEDNEDSKDSEIKLAVQFLKTRELPDRLKWPAWRKADQEREAALKVLRKKKMLKSKSKKTDK